ncbi:hypothetical protein CMI45_01670 [Candidatus Pacearchaeota archaeon]|nr:hypothetical protein [Candidatus Pacearchaeota archaeon]|tara:strand:- start:412 stop:816 length:405 start_codon:yes stop_codon:yes gene_type:complete
MIVREAYKNGIDVEDHRRRYVIPETLDEVFDAHLGEGEVMGRDSETNLIVPVRTEVWDVRYEVNGTKHQSITLVYRFPMGSNSDDDLVRHVTQAIEKVGNERIVEGDAIIDRVDAEKIDVEVIQPVKELSTYLL